MGRKDGTRTYAYNTVYSSYSTGSKSFKRLLVIIEQHIIINDYNVNTVYDTYDQCTVTCLILVRHNRIRANTTYYYLSGTPYPVSLIRYTLPGYARQIPLCRGLVGKGRWCLR